MLTSYAEKLAYSATWHQLVNSLSKLAHGNSGCCVCAVLKLNLCLPDWTPPGLEALRHCICETEMILCAKTIGYAKIAAILAMWKCSQGTLLVKSQMPMAFQEPRNLGRGFVNHYQTQAPKFHLSPTFNMYFLGILFWKLKYFCRCGPYSESD